MAKVYHGTKYAQDGTLVEIWTDEPDAPKQRQREVNWKREGDFVLTRHPTKKRKSTRYYKPLAPLQTTNEKPE